MRKNISKFDIVLIVLLGLVLRLAWLIYARPVPVSDFAVYKQLASDLLAHFQYGYPEPTAYRLPGYPVFLAFLMLFSSSGLWLSLANVILSSFLVYLIFLLTNQLTGSKNIAFIASSIAAVYPVFIFFSPVLASEHLFSVLIYGGLIFLFSGLVRKQWTGSIFAGLLFGLASLTRGEAIYYIPVIGLLCILPVKQDDNMEMKKWIYPRLVSFLILLTAWGLVVLPWYIRNQKVIGPGAGLGTSGGIMFYYGHHDKSQDFDNLISAENLGVGEVARSSNAFQKGLDYIQRTPVRQQLRQIAIEALRQYAPNDYPVFWSVALPRAADGTWPEKQHPGKVIFSALAVLGYLVVGTLAFASLFFIKSYPSRLWITLLGFALMNLTGYAIIFAATSRYRYTIDGFLCILASITIWQFCKNFLQKQTVRRNYPTNL